MNFITALRQHSASASRFGSRLSPPCGGIGVKEWDFALAGTFQALCLKDGDAARLHHLDVIIRNYERRIVVVQEADPTNERVIRELRMCARLLRRWSEELRANSVLRRAA